MSNNQPMKILVFCDRSLARYNRIILFPESFQKTRTADTLEEDLRKGSGLTGRKNQNITDMCTDRRITAKVLLNE